MSFALGFGDLKYERAKLHCNFSMVFPKDANTAPYEPVLCKLAGIMDTLEVRALVCGLAFVRRNECCSFVSTAGIWVLGCERQ